MCGRKLETAEEDLGVTEMKYAGENIRRVKKLESGYTVTISTFKEEWRAGIQSPRTSGPGSTFHRITTDSRKDLFGRIRRYIKMQTDPKFRAVLEKMHRSRSLEF